MAAFRVEFQITGCAAARLDSEHAGRSARKSAEEAAAWCETFADVVWIRDENDKLVTCSFADGN